MDELLVKKYGQHIADQIAQINPYPAATTNHALYELGLLRSILAQCILIDNQNECVLRETVKRLRTKNVSK